MSTLTKITRGRAALAGAALAALTTVGGVATGSASAERATPAMAPASMAAPCTKETDFDRIGNTLYASYHLVCEDSWLKRPVAIEMLHNGGWITVATGNGTASEPCSLQSPPRTYRHSVSKQQIRC